MDNKKSEKININFLYCMFIQCTYLKPNIFKLHLIRRKTLCYLIINLFQACVIITYTVPFWFNHFIHEGICRNRINTTSITHIILFYSHTIKLHVFYSLVIFKIRAVI